MAQIIKAVFYYDKSSAHFHDKVIVNTFFKEGR